MELQVSSAKSIGQITDEELKLLLESTDYKKQEELLLKLGNHLIGWEKVKSIADFNINKILYYVWNGWEKGKIPPGATRTWDYNFYNWAIAFYTERFGFEPAKVTIDNRIRVYRDFIAEPVIEIPEIIYLPCRDKRGKIIPDEWKELENPSFEYIPYSKLLVARGTARQGRLSPDAWSCLFDSQGTVRELAEYIREDSGNKTKDDFRLFEEEGIIYAYAQGEVCPISHLLVENIENPLWRRGIEHLLSGIEVHTPLVYKNA